MASSSTLPYSSLMKPGLTERRCKRTLGASHEHMQTPLWSRVMDLVRGCKSAVLQQQVCMWPEGKLSGLVQLLKVSRLWWGGGNGPLCISCPEDWFRQKPSRTVAVDSLLSGGHGSVGEDNVVGIRLAGIYSLEQTPIFSSLWSQGRE